MERTISVEEKIRRAEEIYARRKQGSSKPIATVKVNEEKRDMKLLKKMVLQVLVCLSIYFIIYTIQNSEYVFSKDFTSKVNEILSYDTNFLEIYNGFKSQLQNGLLNETQEPQEQKQEAEAKQEENINQEGIGGAVEESEEKEKEEQVGETKQLSQIEQDLIQIKSTTTFKKPIEGVISSKYGRRDSATGSVPKNHTGTDIAANLGTKIRAATDGEVVLASEEGDYGKHLKIQIGEVSIIYAHCNDLYVKQGDKVTQGQEIAEVGSTGNSTRSTFTF